MALINHNISTPNDGLGDPLRKAFDDQNQMNSEFYENKVDKEIGKGLSTNDYTDVEKDKLENIEEFAEVNVQSDWYQADNTADDYIKNKPVISEASDWNDEFTYVASSSFDIPVGLASIDVLVNKERTLNFTRIGNVVTVLDALVPGDIVWISGIVISILTLSGGEVYLEKAFLSKKQFNGSGVIETLAIDEKCSYLKLTGPITSFGGIQRISSNYVLGLPFFIEAAITGASMVIKHLEASPNVKFSFPDGLDFTLPKNHIAQFLPTFESGVFLHKFVGVSIGGGGGGSTPKASTTVSGTTKTTTNEADPTVYTFQETDSKLAEKQFKLTPDEGLEIDETIPESPIIKLKPATTIERGGVIIFDDINSSGEFSYNVNQVNARLILKVNTEAGKSLIADTEITRLAGVTNQTKSSLGLDNVDNTSDLNKPISTATQTALNTKQDTLTDTNFATFVNSTTTKDAIADADKLGYFNSVNSKWVNTTWLKVVDYFKGYFQTKTQLITTATTATKGSKYIATGTFTITDFASPVQGDWYEATVRNGTITVGGTDYKSGTIIKRIFDATWKSYVYRQQLPIKISTGVTGTYDIDPTVSDEFSLTLTGNTQLNFPNFSTVFSDVLSGNVSGNFGVTYELGTRVVGSYIGTATLNIFAVKKTNGVVTLSWTNYL